MEPKDRELLIRIDENVETLKKDMRGLDRVVNGNGRLGLKDRVLAIETAHLKKPPPYWPAPVAAICAIIAVFAQFLFK